jgi:hypothetical protein
MKPHALLPCLVCSLLADIATAGEPASASPPAAPSSPFVERARAVVHAQVIAALQEHEQRHSMFSRSPPVPAERRVRILDATPTKDARGAGFVRFAVDDRWGPIDEWNNDDTVGCVYVDDGAVYVDTGDTDGSTFRRAADLFGDRRGGGDDVPVVCRPAPAPSSTPASTTNG